MSLKWIVMSLPGAATREHASTDTRFKIVKRANHRLGTPWKLYDREEANNTLGDTFHLVSSFRTLKQAKFLAQCRADRRPTA